MGKVYRTILADILKREQLMVNALHRQAIAKIGKNVFRVVRLLASIQEEMKNAECRPS